MPLPRDEAMLEAAIELEHLARRRLELARSERWDELVASETRRGELARAIDPSSVHAPDLQQALVTRLRRITDMDDQLRPLLEGRLEELGRTLLDARKGAAGNRAYQRFRGD
ncbi:flagellar protein FliT [Alkalilimnicola ehrlichii MLHE-1]|uniref:Flagellar protein FliT n=1 Tax=Alkalilimnicola ehrlichii (strain ATCC BAA-1101 / DSM 17681 / MLHE-1) TaxID=187272 RepID=Q0AAS8_ALKEH|nr:flagellar protein FliT [Alkalilimnicola ehrlichii]ABI56059.1 flagellar protein FliT [Alkalilimnicola ehrlichii MLHE-1]